MSPVSTSVASKPVPGDDDPFRYGWRDILRSRADGTTFWDQIPLTLEDVLFPEMGDFIVKSAFTTLMSAICRMRASGGLRASRAGW